MSKHTRGIINWEENRETCGNCAFFMQHYVYSLNRFTPMAIGHCIFPNCKDRFETETCKYFEDRAEYKKLIAEEQAKERERRNR